MNILPQPWILGAHSPPWSIGGRGARSASFLRLQPALSRFSCQPLSPQPRAVFMEGFLCPFVIGHRLFSFDLPGRFPKFKFSALPASSFLLDHDCRLPSTIGKQQQGPGSVPFCASLDGCGDGRHFGCPHRRSLRAAARPQTWLACIAVKLIAQPPKLFQALVILAGFQGFIEKIEKHAASR
jgi:hypothetical protein